MRKRYLNCAFFVALAIASQILGSACIAQNSSQLQENALLTAAQVAADNSKDIQALEPKALGAVDAHAERQGSRLTLHLKSGTTRIYEDRPECKVPDKESKCQMYVLMVHASSRNTFIVAKLYYESAEFLLVDDATGEETTLRSIPYFSPSGRYVLVLLINDEQIGFAVQIWHRKGHGFLIDWSGAPYTEGSYTSYELVRWSKENIIVLRAKTNFFTPRHSAIAKFELHHLADGWKVVEVR